MAANYQLSYPLFFHSLFTTTFLESAGLLPVVGFHFCLGFGGHNTQQTANMMNQRMLQTSQTLSIRSFVYSGRSMIFIFSIWCTGTFSHSDFPPLDDVGGKGKDNSDIAVS